jgi:hypothetical protein
VCSFTKAAAAELVSRNLPLDDDHVGTLHAMAFRALGKPALVVSKKETIEQWTSRMALVTLRACSAAIRYCRK